MFQFYQRHTTLLFCGRKTNKKEKVLGPQFASVRLTLLWGMMRVASSHNQEGSHQMRAPKNVEYVDRIIRLPELLAMVATGRSTVYEKINAKSRRYDPSFPKPIRLSGSARSAIGWRLSEVQHWIATR